MSQTHGPSPGLHKLLVEESMQCYKEMELVRINYTRNKDSDVLTEHEILFFSSLFSLEHGIPNWLEAAYRQQTKPDNTKPKSTNKWNSLLPVTENGCYT